MYSCSDTWLVIMTYLIPLINDELFFHDFKFTLPSESYKIIFEKIIYGQNKYIVILPEINIDDYIDKFIYILWDKYISLKHYNETIIENMCNLYKEENNCLPICFSDLKLSKTKIIIIEENGDDVIKILNNDKIPFWYKDFIVSNLTSRYIITLLENIRNKTQTVPKQIMDSILDHHCVPDQAFMIAKLIRREEITGKLPEFDEDIVISLGF